VTVDLGALVFVLLALLALLTGAVLWARHFVRARMKRAA